jgi:hypothetical protein
MATVAYYGWASKIANRNHRITAYSTPVVLVVMLSIVGLVASPAAEPEGTYASSSEPAITAKSSGTEQPTSLSEDYSADTQELEATTEPEPEVYVEPEPEPEVYVEPEPEPEVYVEPEPEMFVEPSGSGYVGGSCKDLAASGLGPFYPGDANYTSQRDRDNDGVACE